MSVLVSSHLLSEIELMCDRIAVIQNGTLIDLREMDADERSMYYIEVNTAGQVAHLLTSCTAESMRQDLQ